MKNWKSKDGETQQEQFNNNKHNNKKKMRKNIQRLGGSGLSLQAFANAKSRNNSYNPALLKKKREFYKNAKHVSKYKKMLKQQGQQTDPSSSVQPVEENEYGDDVQMNKKDKKKGKGSYSLNDLYEKKRQEEEKARMEREAIIKAKKEEREKAEARRKALREKMFKRTRKGQPVMKYRIEHLLETIQRTT